MGPRMTAGSGVSDDESDAPNDQRRSQNYRADIDGLRAAAVLPIVLFHLGFKLFPGGYVGVDIFFVVSGYLIGGIILQQIRQDSYSVRQFYVRRFRRIMPALMVMLFVTTIAAWFVLLPQSLVDYGYSLASAALSVSNFFYLNQYGYFAPTADAQPLLHTWSLGVEEQFYLVFPLMMLLLRRLPSGPFRIVLGGLALLSLGASIIGVSVAPTATFYLLPSRFWELLLGVLAVGLRIPPQRWIRESLAACGLILVAGSITLLTSATPFPGLAALAPCLGTAMLIVAGAQGGTLVGRCLSVPPAVFFGLISYSLYLWHWPIIVLLKVWEPTATLGVHTRIAVLALSVLLAWLSWRYVEQPWRSPEVKGKTVVWTTAAAVGAMSLVGFGVVLANGVPGRFSPEVARLATAATEKIVRDRNCFLGTKNNFADFDQARCVAPDPHKLSVLLMGDSHAQHLWPGLHQRFPQINLLQAAASGCAPTLASQTSSSRNCRKLMRFLFGVYLPRQTGGLIILSARWYSSDEPALAATLDWMKLKGFRVVVAGPVVRYDVPLPQALAIAAQRGDPALVDRVRTPRIDDLDRQFQAITKARGDTYFSPYQALCPAHICQTTTPDGLPIQWDDAHLTDAGSLVVAQSFPPQFFAQQPATRPAAP